MKDLQVEERMHKLGGDSENAQWLAMYLKARIFFEELAGATIRHSRLGGGGQPRTGKDSVRDECLIQAGSWVLCFSQHAAWFSA